LLSDLIITSIGKLSIFNQFIYSAYHRYNFYDRNLHFGNLGEEVVNYITSIILALLILFCCFFLPYLLLKLIIFNDERISKSDKVSGISKWYEMDQNKEKKRLHQVERLKELKQKKLKKKKRKK